MRFLHLIAVVPLLSLATGCAPRAWGPGAQGAASTASTAFAVGAATADFAQGAGAGLLVIVAGLAAIGDNLETGGVPYGPNDEAGAARMRSAHIHAQVAWNSWPPP